MVPLEFFVLRNESPEHHFVSTLEAFVFHHFLWIFSLHQGNISIDAFTSHSAVERLAEDLFNAVPALWAAFLQILQKKLDEKICRKKYDFLTW